MNNSFSKYIILILFFLSIFQFNFAQNFSDSGINIGAKLGGSILLGEIPKDSSGIINEFDNKIGFTSSFEISKYISKRWEIGTEIGLSSLNGETYSPNFSAEGIQPGLPVEINDPAEYKNKLFGLNIFFRYYFKDVDSEKFFTPFVAAGGGFIKYNSKFKYIDAPEDDLIFGKGSEGYAKLSTPVFFVGTGFKTDLSSGFYLLTSIDFKMVDYDFLDVMHNYSGDGFRIETIGIYTEFKVGIFYSFNKSGSNKISGNKNGGSSKNISLPFSR